MDSVICSCLLLLGRNNSIRLELAEISRVLGTAEGLKRFISEHNFQIRQTAPLGGSLAPLCYLEVSIQKW